MLEFYDSFNSGHLVDIGSLADVRFLADVGSFADVGWLADVGSLTDVGWLVDVGSLAGCVGNLLDAASNSSARRIAISLAGSSSNIHRN